MAINLKIKSFSKQYDERQHFDRYKISFETMLLAFALISVNGIIKVFYGPWGAPITEMSLLVSLPFTYFLIRSILKGAYFPIREKSFPWIVLFFAAIGIIYLMISIFYIANGGAIFENGVLSKNLYGFILAAKSLSIPAAYLIKKEIDKNEEEVE